MAVEDTPLSILFAILAICLIASGFFSMSETAMMAINRYRLASRAQAGYGPAVVTQRLLQRTDRLLGIILLGNNFTNTVSASVATLITFKLVGQNELALALATSLVTFAILIFSEATPKVIAATHPEAIAYAVCYPLAFLQKTLYPAVWFVNLFVLGLLRLLQVHRKQSSDQALAPDELRLLVIESARFMEQKHHSILLNLFELTSITVDDVMTPRHLIESVDINAEQDVLRETLLTCHHTRLPAHSGDPDNIIGLLHVRKIFSMRTEEINAD
ncbi:MAG: CNNM domain-containing protein, partial [Formivibrio sp.]|nr:CNNM domain-containing protein [Formivibrio sp.]